MTEQTILRNPKLKNVDAPAQWLYYTALSEGVRRCGIVDVWPKRFATFAADVTEQDITDAALALDRAGVVHFDAETDEMLYPGYLTEVTNVKNSRHVIAVVNSIAGVVSQKLIGLAIWELGQLREQTPTAGVWNDPRVVAALSRPAIDPADLTAGA